MKWFRFYSEAIYDPKLMGLPITARWHWLEILCVASDSEPRGRVRSDRRLQAACNLSARRLHELCLQLVSSGLLDREGEWFIPHGWNKRQMASDDPLPRVQKHRYGNALVTPLDTEVEAERKSKIPEADQTRAQEVGGETDMGLVFSLYEKTFGSLNAHSKQLVEEAVEQYSGNWVREAMKESAANSARNWAYTEAILRRWEHEEAAEAS